MNLSERLKSLRLEQGYTQKELANKLGIAYQNIQKYEKGIAKPLNKNLENLADIFEVSVSYLIGETNVRSSNRINEIMEQLSEPRQEEIINFAEDKLMEQNEENKKSTKS